VGVLHGRGEGRERPVRADEPLDRRHKAVSVDVEGALELLLRAELPVAQQRHLRCRRIGPQHAHDLRVLRVEDHFLEHRPAAECVEDGVDEAATRDGVDGRVVLELDQARHVPGQDVDQQFEDLDLEPPSRAVVAERGVEGVEGGAEVKSVGRVAELLKRHLQDPARLAG